MSSSDKLAQKRARLAELKRKKAESKARAAALDSAPLPSDEPTDGGSSASLLDASTTPGPASDATPKTPGTAVINVRTQLAAEHQPLPSASLVPLFLCRKKPCRRRATQHGPMGAHA